MIYTGQSDDGSDIKFARGMYTSPCGEIWGNQPFTKEQRQYERDLDRYDRLHDYVRQNNRTFIGEHKLILDKKSELNRIDRQFILDNIDNLLTLKL